MSQSADKLAPEVVRQIPLLAGLNDSERRTLLGVSQIRDCAAHEVILVQGQQSQNLWVVLEGSCEVVLENAQGAPVVLAEIVPYENFGEMSFFEAAPHSASVRATDAARVLQLARGDFDRLVEAGNGAACKLAINVVRSLSERMRRMDDWVARLMAKPPEARRNGDWSQFRETLFKQWQL